MKFFLRTSLLLFFCFSCSPKKAVVNLKSDNDSVRNIKSKPSTIFEQTSSLMVCSEYPNIFQIETVDNAPTPKQGVDVWTRDFYMALRYPPDSREKGIQGTVKLEVTFAADGTIESTDFVQQVAPDIDKAAIDAFRIASAKGFTPAVFKGNPVRSKAIVPLHFRLG